jgi:hypothetical protein
MERKIYIYPVTRKEARVPIGARSTPRRYRVFFEGAEIGVWIDPECTAARWLADNDRASRSDMLEIYRGDRLSMSGKLAWFADHRVKDDARDGPSFVKWRPFTRLDEAGDPSDESDGSNHLN